MENTDIRRNNRMMLLLIAGIPVIMILGASWLWYFVARGDLDIVGVLGTANRGELIQPPRQIDGANLTQSGGAEFRYADLDPRWAMVIPGANGRCDTICETSLYETRQIHVGMGKYFNRLQRFYMSEIGEHDTQLVVQELSDEHPLPTTFAAYLAAEHRGLQPLLLAPGASAQLFSEYQAERSSWYLVDPSGWIMMTYNSDTSYKDVIADLKFLLKNSGD